MPRLLASITIALLLILGPAMYTLAQDRGSIPIQLDADNAEVDAATGVGVYTGNVVLTQGERVITGHRMTVHTRSGRSLDHVVVEGDPATWHQPREEGGEILRGEAPRMEYHAANPERVILLEGGRITQGRNTFTGEVIEYNLDTERVVAGGKDSGERIRITLFPEQEENQ